MAGPRDSVRGGARQDGRAPEDGRADHHAAGARGGRRDPLRVPHALRHDGGADEGLLRRHRRPVAGAEPGRQARRHLLQHRHPGRWAGDHAADGGDAADAPRDGVRAGGVHVRRQDVRHGERAGRQPVRRGHVRRGRVAVADGGGAGARLPPGQVLRWHRQEAQGRLRLSAPWPRQWSHAFLHLLHSIHCEASIVDLVRYSIRRRAIRSVLLWFGLNCLWIWCVCA